MSISDAWNYLKKDPLLLCHWCWSLDNDKLLVVKANLGVLHIHKTWHMHLSINEAILMDSSMVYLLIQDSTFFYIELKIYSDRTNIGFLSMVSCRFEGV